MNNKEALTIIRNNLFVLYKQGELEIGKPFVQAIDYIVSHNYDPSLVYEEWGNLSKEIWAVTQAIVRAEEEEYNEEND